MTHYLVFGAALAFAAVVQPGPMQAFLLSRVAAHGWRRTLPAAFAPLLTDGPIALLALLVLRRLPDGAAEWLRAAGGLLLLWLAWSSLRDWQRDRADAPQEGSAPRTFLEAATVNLLNPNPYLAWTLVLGPAVLEAWSKSAAHAAALIGSFYVTIVTGLALTIVAFGATAFLQGPWRRRLLLLAALTLGALGVWMLVVATKQLA